LIRLDIPVKKQIPFKKTRKFARQLAALCKNDNFLKEGDMLVIHGLREEDMEEHYHTILVLKTDPLTGMPLVVSDNSGKPRIRSIASAMRSAPRRSIKHRIRINWTFLADKITKWETF
jgi:hypothetical protein